MSEDDKTWHSAVNVVAAGLYPEMPLPKGITDAKLATLERLVSQARWRLNGQRLQEKTPN